MFCDVFSFPPSVYVETLNLIPGPSVLTVQSRGIFTSPPTPADDFSEPPRNPAHMSAYNPTAEYFNPADCGGSAEDPPVTCIIPPRVCGGFPMKSNDVIMIDR